MKLREYQYDVIYKPGRLNANADALSRNSVDIKLASISVTESTRFNESLLEDELYKVKQFDDEKTVRKNDTPQSLYKASSFKSDKIQKESDAFPTTCRPDVEDEVAPQTEPVLWTQGDRLLVSERAHPSERLEKALARLHHAPVIIIPSSKFT